MCIIPRAKRANVQLEEVVYVAEEVERAGPKSRMVPRRVRPVQLEMVHVLDVGRYVVVRCVDQRLVQVDEQHQFAVFDQAVVVGPPQFLGELKSEKRIRIERLARFFVPHLLADFQIGNGVNHRDGRGRGGVVLP